MALILLGTFFGLLLFNIPVAASMGIAAALGMLYGGYPLSVFPSIMYAAIARYTLLAIPFFILAGVIMDYAGISKRLMLFAQSCVGHRRGGLAIVTVVVACFFAAISGSGPATVAALGSVLIPAMTNAGYKKNFSSALLASAGGIGMVIPPSIPFVVYAMLAEVSVGTMFIAGILPGLLMGISYIVAALLMLRKDTEIRILPKASWRERWSTFKDAFWGLMTPVIILGGIYGGVFTPTEAAGVAVVYGLFVGVFIYREIKLRKLLELLVTSAVTSSIVMFIMGCAGAFTWILSSSGVAADLSAALVSISDNRYVLLLMMNIIFLIAGCFIDSVSGFYIFLPILLPIVRNMGFSVYAFGVLMTANFAVGQVTPPVGSNLFVAINIAKISMKEILQKMGPFIVAGFISLLLMTFIPQIITFLPGIMGLK
jgi:C4-dicarboxylate transporter DctM subunit